MGKRAGRNSLDVVMELVNFHFNHVIRVDDKVTEEDIEKIYLKYYSLVRENR